MARAEREALEFGGAKAEARRRPFYIFLESNFHVGGSEPKVAQEELWAQHGFADFIDSQ